MSKANSLLSRRVAKILPSANGLEQLLKKRKIRLYQGFDPTGKLHIGHGVGLKLLMEFAQAGHEVIFLFGTGTVLVGDPSQRESTRQQITDQEIKSYINGWKKQAAKIVDFKKVKVKQNSDWLVKLKFKDIINIASKVSAIQLFKRDMFQRRLKQNDTVWFHETMYPLLQGYDSVVMDVDLEIGGTDQEFNMLVGRELQKKINSKEKYVLTLPLILGTNGQKMSATAGNAIWMDDPPAEMYGKLMSLPDDQIVPYLRLITDLDEAQIKKIESDLKKGKNPKQAKTVMAIEVTKIYHGRQAAEKASKDFDDQFKKGELPKDIQEFRAAKKNWDVVDLLVETKLADSKSEARRVLEQGGVRLNDTVLGVGTLIVKPGDVLKVGKRRFARIK